MSENLFKCGDTAYLLHDVIEPANDEHPTYLMGVMGEKVEIIHVDEKPYKYLIKGETQDLPWRAGTGDLSRMKPFKQ